MNNLLLRSSKSIKQVGLMALLVFSFSNLFASEGGKMDGVEMLSCGKLRCIKVTSEKAYTSWVASDMSLPKNNVIIFNKKDNKILTTISSNDVFFDVKINRYYIREIQNSKNKEAYYDLKSEVLHTF
jgi:hypothetical protein